MCVFADVCFSTPGRPLGDQGARKDAKMEAKATEKVVRRQLAERAKSMAGVAREAYEEVPGRFQEPLFSGVRCEGLPRGSRGGFGTIFGDFGCPLGGLGDYIFREKCVFFEVLFLVDFRSVFGRGRRQGRAL